VWADIFVLMVKLVGTTPQNVILLNIRYHKENCASRWCLSLAWFRFGVYFFHYGCPKCLTVDFLNGAWAFIRKQACRYRAQL